jgi:myo-inositol-1(or 4)-monophosphatase
MPMVPDFLMVGERAARAGGAALLDWVGRFKAREKGPRDLVTEADLASQEAVRREILGAFPQHDFVSEEGDGPVELGGEFCWVVDPLDGTTNYVHQIPHYAVSLALLQRGKPIVGVIFDPVSGECFTAVKGKGAWLNGQPIRTSGVTELSQAVIAASFSARVEFPSPEIDQFVAAVKFTQGVRRTGSAALNLCYVACGRFDAFWALSTKAWDVAAGVLLVEEAGGAVTRLDGRVFSLEEPHPVATATQALQLQCCEMLRRAVRVREASAREAK